ncbi:DUF2182 domain-containing protein [Dyella acidiphila]|nr:DUF2182 domain-containing protein [Dyella acidiphila]
MPTQTWPGAAASFLSMWLVMMAAMMLPSLLPVLRRYHRQIQHGDARHAGARTLLMAAGYFLVWAVLGALIYGMGIALATVAMRWPMLARIAPLAAGMIVLGAGALQFTRWKAHHLAGCRALPDCCQRLRANTAAVWRYGVQHGIRCCHCCAGLTAILLVAGVMDLRAMALVTAAITAERLAPAARPVAWLIGIAAMGAGIGLLAQAAWA